MKEKFIELAKRVNQWLEEAMDTPFGMVFMMTLFGGLLFIGVWILEIYKADLLNLIGAL